MAAPLSAQRCLNHSLREAVARCPECRGFFCRECVTEHDDRVICSACLRRIADVVEARPRRLGALLPPVQVIAGVLLAWLFFYGVGRVLVSIPSSFHEGTMWEAGMLEDED
jgi:hypothetical protein